MTSPDEPTAPPRPPPGTTSAGWFVEIVRWLLVPVVAIGAMLLVMLAGRLFLPRLVIEPGGFATTTSPLEDMQRIVVRTLVAFGASGAFVVAGSKMAPRQRRATAIVLAGLMIGYSLLAHVVVHLGRGHPNWIDLSLASTAAILSAAYIACTEQ